MPKCRAAIEWRVGKGGGTAKGRGCAGLPEEQAMSERGAGWFRTDWPGTDWPRTDTVPTRADSCCRVWLHADVTARSRPRHSRWGQRAQGLGHRLTHPAQARIREKIAVQEQANLDLRQIEGQLGQTERPTFIHPK